jgi:hypothetical protein
MNKQSLAGGAGKKIFLGLFFVFGISLLVYISLPNPQFPNPVPGAVQSMEPADTETPLRRAYFTDATREEVMKHYLNEFGWGYRLNYPPEEAGAIIRDQTRSTFLEEIVHPLRESIYVNGYEPASNDNKNQININGVHYRQKIIVRFVPSSLILRLVVWVLTLASTLLLVREYINAKDFKSIKK